MGRTVPTFLRVALLVGTSVVLAMAGQLLWVGTLLLASTLLAISPLLGLIGTVGSWLGTGLYVGRRLSSVGGGRLSDYRLSWPSGSARILSGLFVSAGLVLIGLFLLSTLLSSQFWEPGFGIRAPILETTAPVGFDWFLVAFYLIAVGPLLEEVVLRAWLQPKLEGVVSVVPAVLLSAIVFSVLHIQNWGHPEMLLVSLGFGALAGWVSHVTLSMWSAFALHALWNAGALILVAVRPSNPSTLSPAAKLVLVGAGLASLAFGAVLLHRTSVRLTTHQSEERLQPSP